MLKQESCLWQHKSIGWSYPHASRFLCCFCLGLFYDTKDKTQCLEHTKHRLYHQIYSQSYTSRFLKLVSLKQMPPLIPGHGWDWDFIPKHGKVSSTPLTGDFYYHLSTDTLLAQVFLPHGSRALGPGWEYFWSLISQLNTVANIIVVPKINKSRITISSLNSTFGHAPKIQRRILKRYLQTHVRSLFLTAKIWKQPKCPWTDNSQINVVCPYNKLFSL